MPQKNQLSTETQQKWSRLVWDQAQYVERNYGRQLIKLNKKLLESPWLLLMYFLQIVAGEGFSHPRNLEEHCFNVEQAKGLTILHLKSSVRHNKTILQELDENPSGDCDVVSRYYKELLKTATNPERTIINNLFDKSELALNHVKSIVYEACMRSCDPKQFTKDNLELAQNIISIGDNLDGAKNNICQFFDKKNLKLFKSWFNQFQKHINFFLKNNVTKKTTDQLFRIVNITQQAISIMQEEQSFMSENALRYIDESIGDLSGWNSGSCPQLIQKKANDTNAIFHQKIQVKNSIVNNITTLVTENPILDNNQDDYSEKKFALALIGFLTVLVISLASFFILIKIWCYRTDSVEQERKNSNNRLQNIEMEALNTNQEIASNYGIKIK